MQCTDLDAAREMLRDSTVTSFAPGPARIALVTAEHGGLDEPDVARLVRTLGALETPDISTSRRRRSAV